MSPSGDNQSNEILTLRMDQLRSEVARQSVKIENLEGSIRKEREARRVESENALRSGIKLLGTLLIAVVGVLWAYRASIVGDGR